MLVSRVVIKTCTYALLSLRQPSVDLKFSYTWQLSLKDKTYCNLDIQLLLLNSKAIIYSSVSTYKLLPNFVIVGYYLSLIFETYRMSNSQSGVSDGFCQFSRKVTSIVIYQYCIVVVQYSHQLRIVLHKQRLKRQCLRCCMLSSW